MAVIALIGFLAWRSLFKKPSLGGGASAALSSQSNEQIESLLNQLVEKTAKWDQMKSESVTAGGSSPAAGSNVSAVNPVELEKAKAELAQVKKALQEKEVELKKVKEAPPSASGASPAPAAGGDSAEYTQKISDLEAKLAEYEVLEDDIADLSLYKEENARLKAEVERLKGGGEPESEGPGVPEPDSSEDLVKEFAEAVGKEPKAPAEEVASEPEATFSDEEETSPLAAEAEEEPPPIDSPAQEMAATEPPAESPPEPAEPTETVAEAAEAPATEEPPPAVAAASAEASPVEPSPAEPSSSEGETEAGNALGQNAVDDLFAELSSSDLDTDKVVSELADIANMKDEVTPEEALEANLDPDKVAKEADELKS